MAITTEMLEAQKKALQKELERIQKELSLTEQMLAIKTGAPIKAEATADTQKQPTSYSVRGRVVDAIIDLIHSIGRQVSNKEILEYLGGKKGVSLGDTKNKQSMLNAMLSQEIKKQTARLRKVARGIYDIKK